MASNTSNRKEEVTHEFFFFRVHKKGRIEMKLIEKNIPPYDCPFTGVRNKDLIISYRPRISARIFLPPNPTRKLPLIFYVQGNGFCLQNAFSLGYQAFLTAVAAEANVIVFTFTNGGFPVRSVYTCYDDSWAALQWVLTHSAGEGPEPWLNEFADFTRFFICGNSSGGNIAHFLAAKIGSTGGVPVGVRWVGLGLIQPVFAGYDKMHDDMWEYLSKGCKALEDPTQNPGVGDLAMIQCERVWVAVAGDDRMREAGVRYSEALRKIGWEEDRVGLEITPGQPHSFFLSQPNHDHTLDFIKKFASFVNKELVAEQPAGEKPRCKL